MLIFGFTTKVEKVSVGDISISNMKIDFGVIDPHERVNGLIGLDFLKTAGVIINLRELSLSQKNKGLSIYLSTKHFKSIGFTHSYPSTH